MTDQEILQAMNTMLMESEKRMSKMVKEEIAEAKKDIMQGVAVLMDADFKPKFDLLAEEIQSIREELNAQSEALERIEAALPHIPDSKLEYLQGYADAMQDMNLKKAAEEKAAEGHEDE